MSYNLKGLILLVITVISLVFLYLANYEFIHPFPAEPFLNHWLQQVANIFWIEERTQLNDAQLSAYRFYISEKEAVNYITVLAITLSLINIAWAIKLRGVYKLKQYRAISASFGIVVLVYGCGLLISNNWL